MTADNSLTMVTLKARGDQLARPWPGFCAKLMSEVRSVCLSPAGRELREKLSQQFTVSYQRPLVFAMPLIVDAAMTEQLRAFAAAVHRMVTCVARSYFEDEGLRRVVPLPTALPGPPGDARQRARQRFEVDLCRLDLYPTADGEFRLLELNANCPGGVINAGAAAAAWRGPLAGFGDQLESLAFEEAGWMARRFLAVMPHSSEAPECVPVFCERAGWRHETEEISQSFRDLGLVSFVADPGEARRIPGVGVWVRGHVARSGYQKMSVQSLLAVRERAPEYLLALEAGDLAVQNGHACRFVADNKLCLAVFSDDRFRGHFPASDWNLVAPHVPWSRNFSLCGEDEYRRVLRNREGYVLKHPLNTRGLGVVVGADCASERQWESAVERGRSQGWLVQEYVEPTTVLRWPDEPAPCRHDLSIFVSTGTVTGGFARSSLTGQVNVAAGGETHPLLFAC